MAVPTTRDQFKEYCLRALGKPVIEINVDDDQVDDRIDEALRFYWDYHFDGTSKVYLKHEVTQDDIDNGYITCPDNIIGAVRIFSIGNAALSTGDIFNIRYQIALNDLYTLTSVSLVPYYMAMEHIALIEQLLVGQQPIRYNRHKNRIEVDMAWSKIEVGRFLVFEAYELIDPTTYADVWKDPWLMEYATQLIKRQWGANLDKYTGLQLPGGVQFNGGKIYNDADAKIQELQRRMIIDFSLPVSDMVG